MKHVILLLCFALIGPALFAQSKQQLRDERRAERQAKRAAELAQSRAQMIQLIKDTAFVLEADVFIGPFGQEAPISSFQNFMAIVGKQVLINMSFDHNPGWNNWGWNVPGGPNWNLNHPNWGGPPMSRNLWAWNMWGTYNNPARLTDYSYDLSNENSFVVNGSFVPVPGVLYVPFQITIQSNGAGRLTFTTDSGYQIVLTGDVVSPQNASVVEPIPEQ
jgi:hypothetical protein